MPSDLRPYDVWRSVPLWLTLTALLVTRLIWAARLPISNDEVYYWDWGRDLLVSFPDHPPMVAWLARLGSLFAAGTLGARLAVPFMHFFASLLTFGSIISLKRGRPSRGEIWLALLLTQFAPVFGSVGAVALLPDAGLVLFMSLALQFVYQVHRFPRGLIAADGLMIGVGLGLAGLSKYHALPLAAGMLLGLAIVRRKHLTDDLIFYLTTILTAIVLTSPVWWWNATNHWVSFRFQADHGFGGLSWNPLAALRAFAGQIALLSPAVFFAMMAFALTLLADRFVWRQVSVIALLTFLPLMTLLEGVSFFKQTLPHWVMPAFWLLIPAFCTAWSPGGWLWRLNTLYAVTLTLAVPTVMSIASARTALVESFDGRPGPFGEYTMWPYVVEAAANHPLTTTANARDPSTVPEHCPKPYTLASLRWFWTSQLAFHWADQPVVANLDLNHTSYYDFRDAQVNRSGCPVLIVADLRHFDREQLAKRVTIESQESLVVNQHLDVPAVILLGTFR